MARVKTEIPPDATIILAAREPEAWEGQSEAILVYTERHRLGTKGTIIVPVSASWTQATGAW